MFPTVRNFLLSVTLLTSGALPVSADALEEANTQFAAGKYAEAASAYERLMETSGPTATRLFNLGNARFRLGENGPAILAYERAALLAPRDPDIRANLKLARQTSASYQDPDTHTWWDSVLQGCSLHEWSWITAAGAALLGIISLTWGIAGISRPWIKRAVIAGVVLGTAAASLGGVALWNRRGETARGIVTAANATLRLSPFAEAGSAGSPGTGRTVQLGERTNGWVYVTVHGANLNGWLPDKDVAPLIPGS